MARDRQVGLNQVTVFISMFTMWNFVLYMCLNSLQIVSGSENSLTPDSVTSDCAARWPNCICNAKSVECHNEKRMTDITEFYHCIEDGVENVTIVGSRLHELPENTMGSCRHDSSLKLNELKFVDLSNNTVQIIHGKSFHCMSNVEALSLAHNEWMVEKHPHEIGYFTNLPALKHLDLTNAFEEMWDGSIHFVKLATVFNGTDMSELQTLKLAHNEFFSFPESAANSLCNLEALSTLDLSHNNLDSPSLPTRPECLENLQWLNLSYNQIPVLGKEFMEKIGKLKNLKEVKLDNNPYDCDCGLLEMWHWLNSTNLPVNKNELKCASGFHSSYIGRPVLSLKPADLLCVKLEEPSSTAERAVIGVIFAVIGVTVVAFLIMHRSKLKLIAKRWRKRMPKVAFRSHQGYSTVQEQVAVI